MRKPLAARKTKHFTIATVQRAPYYGFVFGHGALRSLNKAFSIALNARKQDVLAASVSAIMKDTVLEDTSGLDIRTVTT